MFWRRKRIREHAKELGDLMFALGSAADSLSYDDFIVAARRRGLRDSYVDLKDRSCGFSLGFVEGLNNDDVMGSPCFSFHASFKDQPGVLSAEGHYRYYGLLLIRTSGIITVRLSAYIPANEIGSDARLMHKELLKFPGYFPDVETAFGLQPRTRIR